MSELVPLIDDIAKAVIDEEGKNGEFLDTSAAFSSCVELLAGLEEFQFPILTPKVSDGVKARWTVYWEVGVLPKSLTISLINGDCEIISKCYRTY